MEQEEKTNGNLDYPSTWINKSTKLTSVNFSANLHDQAKRHGISLKDAMEFGIRFLIGDKDGFDYPPCNLINSREKVIKHRNALLQEVEALREQLELKEKKDE